MGLRSQIGWRLLIGWLLPVVGIGGFCVSSVRGQTTTTTTTSPSTTQTATAPSTRQESSTSEPAIAPAKPADTAVAPELVGRTVEDVRVSGNSQVSSQMVLNQVRTHQGDKFDPATVEEDYQKIYTLKRFSSVEARVEPTTTGVIVIFEVTEEKLIHTVRFTGNKAADGEELRKAIDLHPGEAIEQFRITLAKQAIRNLYRSKNYPYCHVDVDNDELTRTGDLVFKVTEAQKVTIRNIEYIGAKTYSSGYLESFLDSKNLRDRVKTTRYWWIFNAGTFESDQVDADVAELRHFYQSNGFFDVKVGRKLIVSPDQTEMQVNFLIDEGVRFRVDKVTFVGNTKVPDAVLKKDMHLLEGHYFDDELLHHDVKEIVKAYSPLGYVYQPNSTDPAYLRIGKPLYPWIARVVYHDKPGAVELVYEISEGRPMKIGRIIIKGNDATKDNVIQRELHVQPGQLYNSGELEDAVDRLHGVASFSPAKDPSTVTITPIGDAPDSRDVLVEVKEQHTADVNFGGSVNSNLGLAGNFVFDQHNFDLTNVPTRFEDILSDKAFAGAGQDLRISFSPGVEQTSASVQFTEPYVFDQPYSNSDEAHFLETQREEWTETRAGGSISLGHRIGNDWTVGVSFAGEDVKVGDIQDFFPTSDRVDVINYVTNEPKLDSTGHVITQLRSRRAPDVLNYAGHNTLTDVGLSLRWDTTNHGPLLYRGNSLRLNYALYGALGGEYHYNQFGAAFDSYQTIYTDMLDRRTILTFHLDSGYILNDAPFFNRFYAGGLGGGGSATLRGFEYRGVGPRAGRDLDPIGGDFSLIGSLGLNYPIFKDNIRGVIFTDFGTVESDIRIHTIRQSVGAGVRVIIPALGPRPLAFDLGFPIFKGPNDIKSIFSFGAGVEY